MLAILRVMKPEKEAVPHIVCLGAGFGGLELCKWLAGEPCRITLIDRQNHHLFQPLLYQVATAALALPDVSEPVRKIFGKHRNVTVLMDEVLAADPATKTVTLASGELTYDYLVVAVGATNNYCGNDSWAEHSIGLKTLKEAFEVRQQVLGNLEKAELTSDENERRKLMTVTIVGGGPAGVEMAGALAELTKLVVNREFRRINPADCRIVLIHSRDKVLNYFPDPLPQKALKSLEKKGVEVRLNSRASDIREGEVVIGDDVIPSGTIVWTAGVSASPVTRQLGLPVDKGGRLEVLPDCSLPGHPEIFGIGDCISLKMRMASLSRVFLRQRYKPANTSRRSSVRRSTRKTVVDPLSSISIRE